MNQANHHDSGHSAICAFRSANAVIEARNLLIMHVGPPLKRRTVPKPSHLMERSLDRVQRYHWSALWATLFSASLTWMIHRAIWLIHCDCGNERTTYQPDRKISCGCHRDVTTAPSTDITEKRDASPTLPLLVDENDPTMHQPCIIAGRATEVEGITVCDRWKLTFRQFSC